MLVAVTNCVSHGGAFFFRKPREARPIECSLLDLHEIAEETGISVDEVICGLDDFGSADTLMGFGVPLAEPVNVREILHIGPDLAPRIVQKPVVQPLYRFGGFPSARRGFSRKKKKPSSRPGKAKSLSRRRKSFPGRSRSR